jgi:hypothetical protein
MSIPSSITFNVGAPTFRMVGQPFRGEEFHYASKPVRKESFPFWNDASTIFTMPLKTNFLHKPSSNTLNVGGPTFSVAHSFSGEAFHDEGNIAQQQRTPSRLKGLSYRPVSR